MRARSHRRGHHPLERREFGYRPHLAAHQPDARHTDPRNPGQEELADARP
ncbi:hypothetical protein [Streptomyces sp. NPDC053720]